MNWGVFILVTSCHYGLALIWVGGPDGAVVAVGGGVAVGGFGVKVAVFGPFVGVNDGV